MKPDLREDTICAISTPIGEGGIGIVRISGPEALRVARRLFQPDKGVSSLRSHYLHHGWIRNPSTNEPVDEALLSYMAAPRTYTREDIVEINCHSGYATLNRILELVLQSGTRLAEPGEFTRRAFLNGRIDLSQAEAVIEIIRSRSEESLLLAGRHLQGGLRDKVLQWRDGLLGLQAHVEASIDFSDDLPDSADETASGPLLLGRLNEELIGPLTQSLAGYESSRILREGLTIVLVGKPNVGKSSLLNALLGKKRAIVTPFPGTTRDVVEDGFTLSGIMVRILDTAGIRHEPDEVESFGIERTIESVEEADVVLWLVDGSRPITHEDDMVCEAVAGRNSVLLLNKADLPVVVTVDDVESRFTRGNIPVIRISAKRPPDIEQLKKYLADNFLRQPLERARSTIAPNLRHKGCLEGALSALARAGELLERGGYGELVSMELEAARKSLDSILGREGDDEVLDRVFSEFCVGK